MAMDAASIKCETSECRRKLDIDRCRREIEEVERLLTSGHPDVAGLCLALSDWSAELRMILAKERREWLWVAR